MNGPDDPEPSLVVEDGGVVAIDGRRGGGLRRARPLHRAPRPRSRRRAPRPSGSPTTSSRGGSSTSTCPRAELVRLSRGLTPARLARVVGAARPGRDDVRAQEAARPAGAGQPGARHEPEGEPGPARGRRRRGGRARLRGDRDDGRRLALRAAERDGDAGRLADRAAGRDDAVRGRGAPQPPAGDPGARHLRRDALRLRHRARLRRRRRHALVEGVPRLGLRLARRQGALHLRAAARRR